MLLSKCLEKFVFQLGENGNTIVCPVCGLTRKAYVYDFRREPRVKIKDHRPFSFKGYRFHMIEHTNTLDSFDFTHRVQIRDVFGKLREYEISDKVREVNINGELHEQDHCVWSAVRTLLEQELTSDYFNYEELKDMLELNGWSIECPIEKKENVTSPKKLKKVDEETHKETVEKLKQSKLYVPNVTIENNKIAFRIPGKKIVVTTPLENADKFLQKTDEEIVSILKKKFDLNIDGYETRKNIVKVLPKTIKINDNVKIEPTIISKQPLWKIELYVKDTLKLTRRVEHYWWSKDRKLMSDIVNSMNPKATAKQRKLNRALVEEVLAKWGKQNEILSKNDLLTKFGYLQIITTEPIDISLDEIYHYVGENVRVRGRVISMIKGVRDLGNEHIKHILLYLDSVEGTEANIPVSHLPSMNEPDPIGIIEVEGVVDAEEVRGARTSFSLPLMVIINTGEIKRTSLYVEEYTPTPEDLADFQKHFGQINNQNALDVIDQTVAPYVAERRIEKMFTVLGWLSPIELPLRGGVEFLLTTLLVGDPRTGKDLILEYLAKILSPVTFIINAEMAKQTGIIGACDRDRLTGQWIIRWGVLVMADKLGAVLQGISSYDQENIRQMREILAKRKASIEKVVRGERPCRCRLLMSGNCRYEVVGGYKTRLQAARDTGSKLNQLFLELPDWLRIHISLVFAESDVSYGTIDESLTQKDVKPLIPAEVFKKKVADTWRRMLKDFNIKDEIIKEAKKVLQSFRKKYGNVPIAMLKSEGLYIFLSHVMSFATLRNSLDKQNRIKVENSDVEFIKEMWEKLFKKLNLDLELQRIKEEEKMAQKVVSELLPVLEKQMVPHMKLALATFSQIIELLYSANKPLTKEELSQDLQISDVTIWKYMSKSHEYLYNLIPQVPKLIEGVPHLGLRLTSFGRLVAKAMKSAKTH